MLDHPISSKERKESCPVGSGVPTGQVIIDSLSHVFALTFKEHTNSQKSTHATARGTTAPKSHSVAAWKGMLRYNTNYDT